jgi:PIN domain nuclease of toxin-antitoxin system
MTAHSFLIDTHIFIWWMERSLLLSQQIREILREEANAIFVSSAVPWEIAIKSAKGRLRTPPNFAEVLVQEGFQPLSITHAHALAVGELPPIHNDPFDRIQLAQAKHEGLTFITADKVNLAYPHIALIAG